jgi:hypothetical protein
MIDEVEPAGATPYVRAMLLLERRSGVVTMPFDRDGQEVGYVWARDDASLYGAGLLPHFDTMGFDGRATKEQLIDTFSHLAPWFLFLELIQVRPYGVGEVAVDRGMRRRQDRINDGPLPFVRYNTLTITLGTNTREVSTKAGRGSGGVEFHSVRGHWAHYEQLFGKYRQVVWKPEHHRGYQRLGVIAKRYDTRVEREEVG